MNCKTLRAYEGLRSLGFEVPNSANAEANCSAYTGRSNGFSGLKISLCLFLTASDDINPSALQIQCSNVNFMKNGKCHANKYYKNAETYLLGLVGRRNFRGTMGMARLAFGS